MFFVYFLLYHNREKISPFFPERGGRISHCFFRTGKGWKNTAGQAGAGVVSTFFGKIPAGIPGLHAFRQISQTKRQMVMLLCKLHKFDEKKTCSTKKQILGTFHRRMA
jgi:hypothetical protein